MDVSHGRDFDFRVYLRLLDAASYYFRFLENGILLEDLAEESIYILSCGRGPVAIHGRRLLPVVSAGPGS